MTDPIVAARRFAIGFFLGAVLGLWYGFLRPLRPRHTTISDLLFLLGAGWMWLYYMFAVCRGDLRLGAFFALLLGCIVWERTAGLLIRPVFFGFWHFLARSVRLLILPFKKFLAKIKILFALFRKSVTIKWSNRRQNRRSSGGVPHGRTRQSLSQYPIHRSARSPEAEISSGCPDPGLRRRSGGIGRGSKPDSAADPDRPGPGCRTGAAKRRSYTKERKSGFSSSIREIAKEELGLVDPGTIILDPNS